MFTVTISPEARPLLDKALAEVGAERPGVTIHRQGKAAELKRTADGQAAWSIETPHPWGIKVGSFETIADTDEDVQVIDGVRVWLALLPRPDETGIVITVRNGQLHVETASGSQ